MRDDPDDEHPEVGPREEIIWHEEDYHTPEEIAEHERQEKEKEE